MKWRREPDPAEIDQMITLATKATEKAPDRSSGWLQLADLYALRGDHGAALAVLTRGVDGLPDDIQLHAAWVEASAEQGSLTSTATGDAAALEPHADDQAGLVARFNLLLRANDKEAAALLVPDLMKSHAADQALLGFVLDQCRSGDELRKLSDYCDALLSMAPGCTAAVHTMAVALSRQGRDADARALISVEDLVQISQIAPPAGYASAHAFHDALIAEIRGHPTLVADPRGRSTRGGKQTGFLKSSDGPAIASLIAHMKLQVDEYADSLAEAHSSFWATRPEEATMSIWAVIYDDHGRQDSHFHPSGWLSGVYYPQAGSGDLLIGALDAAEAIDPPWGARAVDPVEGRLVLFPSYVPHSTAPAAAGRVSVAFDVMPST